MRPVNFEIKEREGDTSERLIKKFLKKTNKTKTIQFFLDSLNYETRSQKRRKKKVKSRYIRQKIQQEYLESIKKLEND